MKHIFDGIDENFTSLQLNKNFVENGNLNTICNYCTVTLGVIYTCEQRRIETGAEKYRALRKVVIRNLP